MNKKGPIIVIEDDPDDQHLMVQVFQALRFPNEIIFFEDGERAFSYLKKDEVFPFLILSDINMPGLNGIELRSRIHGDPEMRSKCVPYLFFTTTQNQKTICDAYKMSVQGFFVKPVMYEDLIRTIRLMVEYWQVCYSP